MPINLAEICKALYCICRFYPFKTDGAKKGKELEQIFLDYCISQRIQPSERCFTLFGFISWSGIHHEVDSAVQQSDTGIHFEFKAYEHNVVKDQIMIFNEKSIDYFFSIISHNPKFNFYRVFVSDSPLDTNATRLCYLWNIIVVQPEILPIPVILKYFRDPLWEDRVEAVLLSEGERILGKFMRPLNSLLSPIKIPQKYVLSIPTSHEIDEVQDAHKVMSQELLEAIESYEPDHFEQYASKILENMGVL